MMRKEQNKSGIAIAIIMLLIIVIIPNSIAQENLYLKGLANLRQKKYAAAEALFSSALQNQPDIIQVRVQRGVAFFYSGNYNKALSDFQKVDALKTGDATFWLAKTFVMKGEDSHAIETLKRYLSLQNKKSEKEILLDPVLSRLENNREWRALWKQDWFTPTEHEKAEVSYLLSKGAYRTALLKNSILLNQYPEDAVLYFNRARIFQAQGKQSLALQDLNHALDIDPENPEILRFRASFFDAQKQERSALNDYSALLAAHPENFDVYIKRARVNKNLKQYKQAINDVKQYLNFFPENDTAEYLGGSINLEAGNYYEALSFFNRLLARKQGNKEAFVGRGITYYKLHTYKQSADDFSMALDLDPGDAEVYFLRGKTRLENHETRDACYDFNKAFRMGERRALKYLQENCNY